LRSILIGSVAVRAAAASLMQPPLGFKRDLRRSVIPCAVVAGVLALAASLVGAGGASGQEYLVPMEPFPIVRIVGEVRRSGVKVTRLSVKGPAASVIVTRCKPASKCPYKERERLIPGPKGATRTVRLRRLERRYRGGATVRVFVVKSGFIGKYTSFIIRRGRQPRRYDRCVRGIDLKRIRCPAG